jgi:hypothetical protein
MSEPFLSELRLTKPGERRDYSCVRRGTWMELTRQ